MSVINQMLNDLDARSKQGQAVAAMPRAVQAVHESKETSGFSGGWRWMIGLVVLLLLLVLWFAWTRPRAKMEWHASSLATATQTAPIVAPSAPAQVPAASALASPSAQAATPAPAPVSTPTPTPATPTPAPVATPAPTAVAASAPVPPASLGSLKLRLIPELKLLTTKVSAKASEQASAQVDAPESTPAPANKAAVASRPSQTEVSKPETPKGVAQTYSDNLPVKQIKALSSQQRAESEFRHALQAKAQGHQAEALQALEQALQWDRQHTAARQTLVAWLLESGQPAEAIRHLKEGLAHDPGQAGLAMILARLQVDQGQVSAALATLQRSLPYTLEGAEYHAFLAALLQRQQNHKETIEHYQIALRLKPENALWWMGLGISLQADRQNAAARDAFQRAKSNPALTPGFTPDLQSFVEQRLSQIP